MHQRIAQVVHVGKTRQAQAQGLKFTQAVHAKRAEHHQSARPNHPIPLADGHRHIIEPVHSQVGPQQIELMARNRQRMRIGA